jgi:glycosyltransferase involved in cell wall biosynthesis
MSQARRVAFVSHSMRLYGASRSLLGLLSGFRAERVEVCVILPGPGPMADALRARGIVPDIIPFPCWAYDARQEPDPDSLHAAEARSIPAIVEVLRRFRPDVVVSNTSLTSVGALAARALNLPHVWILRELSREDFPYCFTNGTRAAVSLMRTAQARIAVSEAVRAVYEAEGSGPCTTIYNGAGTVREIETRAAALWLGGTLRIVLPGRVIPSKGQLTAIEAMRMLVERGHDVRLRILGDGELQPCRAAIERFGLQDVVTLAGFVDDLDADYRQAHLALACAPLEAMGRTTVEAMSYGLPVIGYGATGTAELIRHEVTGLLYDGSAQDLARAVERLAASPDAIRQMGQRGREEALRRFSDDGCVRATLEVIDRVRLPLVETKERRGGDALDAGGIATSEP